MKSNQTTRVQRNDRAEVGIGTMIVFIAAVIVAAVAAAVLINTAGNLQRKASETGEETQQEVAANMFVRDIVGYDAGTDNDVDEVYLYVSLAPGADPVDLDETVLRWKNDANLAELNLTEADTSSGGLDALAKGFNVTSVASSSGDNSKNVLSAGDRVKLTVALGSGEEVGMRESVDLKLIPETGTPVDASFSTPATFGGDTYRSLK